MLNINVCIIKWLVAIWKVIRQLDPKLWSIKDKITLRYFLKHPGFLVKKTGKLQIGFCFNKDE